MIQKKEKTQVNHITYLLQIIEFYFINYYKINHLKTRWHKTILFFLSLVGLGVCWISAGEAVPS